MNWKPTLGTPPKFNKQYLGWVYSKTWKGISTGEFFHDKGDGKDYFIPDAGGRNEIYEVPLYSEIRKPNKEEIELSKQPNF